MGELEAAALAGAAGACSLASVSSLLHAAGESSSGSGQQPKCPVSRPESRIQAPRFQEEQAKASGQGYLLHGLLVAQNSPLHNFGGL